MTASYALPHFHGIRTSIMTNTVYERGCERKRWKDTQDTNDLDPMAEHKDLSCQCQVEVPIHAS